MTADSAAQASSADSVAAAPSLGSIVARPLRVAGALPVVGRMFGALSGSIESAVDDSVAVVLRAIVAALVAEVDLTKLVIDHVDLQEVVRNVNVDEVVAQADLDLAVGRVDIDHVVSRVNLIDIANDVIRAIDLHRIIHDATLAASTGAITEPMKSAGQVVEHDLEKMEHLVGGLVRHLSDGRSRGSDDEDEAGDENAGA